MGPRAKVQMEPFTGTDLAAHHSVAGSVGVFIGNADNAQRHNADNAPVTDIKESWDARNNRSSVFPPTSVSPVWPCREGVVGGFPGL